MAVPNIKKINECAAIQYGSTPIKGVTYCDSYGNPHEVWPATTVLSDPYIVDLDEDKAYEYAYDANTGPSPCLKPGHHYAIKMTLTRRNANRILEQYSDCYLSHLTFLSGYVGGWRNKSNSEYSGAYPDKSPRVGSGSGPYVQESFGYSVYDIIASENSSTQAEAGVYGAFYRNDMEDFFTTGYFGDDLYSTPIVLKRATIYEDPTAFYTDNSHTDSAHRLQSRDGNILHVNESITLYPKVHKSASDPAWTQQGSGNWDKYELQSYSNISYDNSVFTVVENQNGSYTITAIGGAGTDARVTFSSSDYVGFTIVGTEYRVTDGNTVVTSSGITITSATPLTIEECSDPLADPQVWSTYIGNNYTITSANTNIVSVSGKTLIPVSFGASTSITVTVEGQQVLTFPVSVPVPSTLHFRVGSSNDAETISSITNSGYIYNNGTPNNNCTGIFNTVSDQYFGMQIGTNSSFTTEFEVYFNTNPRTDNNVGVYLTNSPSGSIFITSIGSFTNGDVLHLPVYSDSAKTNQIGQFVITLQK